MRHPSTLVLATALAAAIVTGCSSPAGPSAPGASGLGEGGELTVALTEFAFTPGPVATTSGPVTFHVVNDGAAPHQFALSRLGEAHDQHLVDSGELGPGERTSVSLELAAGTYEIACHVPGHFEAGMVTTLTVAD